MQFSISKTLSSCLKLFIKEDKGAVAVIFAVVLLPVIAFSGAMVDYSAVSSARSEMQVAVDVAALATVRADKDDDEEMQEIAEDVFNDNLVSAAFANNVELVATRLEDGVRIDVTTSINTSFLRLIGISNLQVSVYSEVITSAGLLELALVLDTTLSMRGSKLRSLKNSATALVDAIMEDDRGGSVKVGIVPFARYVNIGMNNRNEPGIDVAADYTDGESCTRSCSWRRTTSYSCNLDGVPSTCWNWERYNCGPETCTPRIIKWWGCVGSRDYPLNVRDEGYGDEVPGLISYWNNCSSRPLTRLTNNKPSVLDGINAMSARDKTYIPSGLSWGWRILSNNYPFNDGAPSGDEISKALILMTDGNNTVSPSYPWHWGEDTEVANDLTEELCDNIKDEDIIIYTIAFDVDDNDIEEILEDCAGNGGSYFDADDSAELLEAFEDIGNALKDLRISK